MFNIHNENSCFFFVHCIDIAFVFDRKLNCTVPAMCTMEVITVISKYLSVCDHSRNAFRGNAMCQLLYIHFWKLKMVIITFYFKMCLHVINE